MVDGHDADHGTVALIELAEFDGDVLTLARMDLLAVAKCKAECGIDGEVEVASDFHAVDGLVEAPNVEVGIALPVVLAIETDHIVVGAEHGAIAHFDKAALLLCLGHDGLDTVAVVACTVAREDASRMTSHCGKEMRLTYTQHVAGHRSC